MRSSLRVLLGAFGDPGHAFPIIALGRALAARGHDVTVQTWERWRAPIEAEGLSFSPAPEYHVFPSGPEPLDFYEAVVHATLDTLPLVAELEPDVVVADILTLAPALAAELEGVPQATLIPHVFPEGAPGLPIYSLGARLPRTAVGRAFWRRAGRPLEHGLQLGRAQLNDTRARVGLPPLDYTHGGTSRELALVATFPQLEYPRSWPAHAHVVGPLMWEPPAADVELPPGDEPLVLVAPSTAQDPSHRMLHAALRGLADAPVRVLATWNRRLPPRSLPVPANASVVVCHAGHGTLVRALSSGCAVVACPAIGDMNENASRVSWAGAGVRVPQRFILPRPLRLAVERALAEPSIRGRAQELAGWASSHDAVATAAGLVEKLAMRKPIGLHNPSLQAPNVATLDSDEQLPLNYPASPKN
jgi:UDP:flavonoid glycosyltransferase YjiC (YdhE family)